jgi:hypothetical protein
VGLGPTGIPLVPVASQPLGAVQRHQRRRDIRWEGAVVDTVESHLMTRVEAQRQGSLHPRYASRPTLPRALIALTTPVLGCPDNREVNPHDPAGDYESPPPRARRSSCAGPVVSHDPRSGSAGRLRLGSARSAHRPVNKDTRTFVRRQIRPAWRLLTSPQRGSVGRHADLYRHTRPLACGLWETFATGYAPSNA